MSYEFSFGAVRKDRPPRKAPGRMRLAVLGDFSARASRREGDTGKTLSSRKPMKVDVDNIDDLVGRMGIRMTLALGDDDDGVEIEIGSLDDFHPDELFENLGLFEELGSLRRKLDSGRWESAAAEIMGWAGDGVGPKLGRRSKAISRGSSLPSDRKLSDFKSLLGAQVSGAAPSEAAAEDLVRRVVAPYVVDTRDPSQDEMIALVDEALSDTMRSILHHPDFQTVEALWRSVDLLTRSLETGGDLQIVLYDITAEELAADLAEHDTLEDTALYDLLVEQPALDAQQGELSVILGCYSFEQTPPHAELLGRMAKIAAAAGAPFLAGISKDVIKKVDPDDVHPLIRDSWAALRAMPEARYLGLVTPRFMLRNPYGAKTDPIDAFEFEEFTSREGVGSMLWGNGAVIAALLLGQTAQKKGMKGMKLGSVLSVGDMPYHFYTDADGDQIALPCTDRMLNVRAAEWVGSQGFMALVSMQGKPEVRLAGLNAFGGDLLAGPWGQYEPPPPEPEAPPPPAASDDDEPDTDDGDGGDDDDSGGDDDDLDALLASLGGDDDDDSSDSDDDDDDEDMDPELAALLADL